MAGDNRGVDTPVLVPNTEVKDSIAEGSAGLACVRVGRRRPFFFARRRKNREEGKGNREEGIGKR